MSCDIIRKKEIPEDYKIENPVFVTVLRENKTSDMSQIINIIYNRNSDSNNIPIKFDGWYTITNILIPTGDWFRDEKNQEIINSYDIIYYIDNETIYKYVDNTILEVHVSEIIDLNPINTTLSITNEEYVSTCFLKKCYINLSNEIVNNKGFSNCYNDANHELIYKRDLAWMALNIIQYKIDEGSPESLLEALKIINTIYACNGICTNNNVVSKFKGCGCKY